MEQKQHIVHIITTLQYGGAEQALVNLITKLQNDFKHTVIFFYDGPQRQRLETLGIPCQRVSCRGGFYNPFFLLRLYRLVKKLGPDCIHTDLWAANFLGRIVARMLRVPCVCGLHNIAQHNGCMRRWMDKLLPINPCCYVAVSAAVQTSMRASGCCHQTLITLITNGISVPTFLQLVAQEKTTAQIRIKKLPPHTMLIGTVGRLIPSKNYPLLICSMSTIIKKQPQVHLFIIGSGPEEENLRKLIQQFSLEQHISIITGQSAAGYYPFFDCFVQPSQYEGLSIALLEAMACSLAVIVTGDNHQHEVIIHQQNGLVITPNSEPELCAALLQYIEQSNVRAQHGSAAYTTVSTKFSMAQTAAQYQHLFKKLQKQNL